MLILIILERAHLKKSSYSNIIGAIQKQLMTQFKIADNNYFNRKFKEIMIQLMYALTLYLIKEIPVQILSLRVIITNQKLI